MRGAVKVKIVNKPDGTLYGVRWDCPGCGRPHVVPTTGPQAWGWNGDYARPTLTPSVVVRWRNGDGDDVPERVCHCFIRDGRIEFCSDSTHALAGKTVDVPEIE